MEQFKFNKTIVIAVLAILLAGLSFAYDFQSQQAVKKEINQLKTEMASLKAGQPLICPDCNVMAGQGTAQNPANMKTIAGQVKGIEGEIITLPARTLTLEKNRWVTGNETREYKVAVTSATKITYKTKDGKLADIKVGDYIIVFGNADSFHSEEVVAETIVAR